jgi:hypothetical protein
LQGDADVRYPSWSAIEHVSGYESVAGYTT